MSKCDILLSTWAPDGRLNCALPQMWGQSRAGRVSTSFGETVRSRRKRRKPRRLESSDWQRRCSQVWLRGQSVGLIN